MNMARIEHVCDMSISFPTMWTFNIFDYRASDGTSFEGFFAV
jgi:hypothetical protein